MKELMTGAQILLECLRREGVEHLFGYPGGATLPIYEVLYDHEIRHILMRHEENACFAAQGYARVSGRVGVCCATSGPGATNLITGLANAYMDSIPLVAITGQVSTKVLGTTAFQEADTFGISLPCTKHNYQVRRLGDLPRVVREAFHLASTGRPGPVLIDVPKDVQLAHSEYEPAEEMDLPGYQVPADGDPAALARAVDLIWQSACPVVYAGGGIINADAAQELTALVRLLEVPAVCTLMGLGGLAASDPHFVGMPGMHGTYAANMALTQADLLIALGVRFDDRVTGKLVSFAPHAKVIHVDVDPAEIGKIRAADVGIVGDVRRVIEQLYLRLAETHPTSGQSLAPQRREWLRQVKDWNHQYPIESKPSEEVIQPQHLMVELDRLTAGETIVCCDVGQHQMWAAQFLRFNQPRLWNNSGGLGSMGFGLPAAIGAQIACPTKAVVALVGDGGFQMSIPELATIANYSLPIKVIIANNGYLGMVRQWQELFHRNRLSAVQLDTFPDVTQLCAAYGLRGRNVQYPHELSQMLAEEFHASGPSILNVRVAPLENVYPMVPTGAGIHEMVLGPTASPAPATASSGQVTISAAESLPAFRTLRLRVQKTPGALQRILTAVTAQSCATHHLTVRPSRNSRELSVRLTLEGDEKHVPRAVERIRKLVNVIQVREAKPANSADAKRPPRQRRATTPPPESWEAEIAADLTAVEDGVA